MFGMTTDELLWIVLKVALVLISTVLHEVSHAAAANALGDATAKERGRLTLNPFAHLDPVGSVLLPLVMAFLHGPIFAFAKPVPYNPARLRHPIRDEVLVALAGPACNLVQALVGTAAFRIAVHALEGTAMPLGTVDFVETILYYYVYLNLMLMFFNLIPLPPLDGSAILSPLLRGKARAWYYQVQHYALPVLLAIMYLIPMVFKVNPLGIYLQATADQLTTILLGY